MTAHATTSPTDRRSRRGLSTLGVVVVVCAALAFGAGCESSGGSTTKKDEPLTEETNQEKYDKALDDPANLLSRPTKPLIPADAPRGGTLRRVVHSTPRSYNWLTENGADLSELQSYVHNSFATRDLSNPTKWIPELAYKITRSDDGRTYTFHIREGVMWQMPLVAYSGEADTWLKERRELTAEDCAFTFELTQHPQTKAGALKAYFRDLEKVEVVDRYTFKVVWKKSEAHTLGTTLGMYPMPKWLYSRDRQGNPLPASDVAANLHRHWANDFAIGTGPYRVMKVAKNKHIRLERNPMYWGRKPPISTIDYLVHNNSNQIYDKLRNGEVDLAELTPSQYQRLIADAPSESPFTRGTLAYKVVDRPAYYYLGWNADGPYFSDKRVRRAMTHALNRNRIIKEAVHGLGEPMSGPILPSHPGSNPNIDPFEFNLQKAAKLLDEAGWTDSDGDGIRDKVVEGQRKAFVFTMVAFNDDVARKYLEIFRNDLRTIGVVMKVQPTGWALIQRLMDQRQFDAFTGGWALGWEVDPFQIWHSSQADVPRGSNRVGFRNAEADKIIETLRTTFDKAKRKALLHKFHGIIHEEQPYTFLYRLRTVYAWRPALKNVQFQPLRPTDLSLPWYFVQDETTASSESADATESQ